MNSLPGISSLVSVLLPQRAGGPAQQDQRDAVGRQARLGASRGGGECPDTNSGGGGGGATVKALLMVSALISCCGAAQEGSLPDAGRGSRA